MYSIMTRFMGLTAGQMLQCPFTVAASNCQCINLNLNDDHQWRPTLSNSPSLSLSPPGRCDRNGHGAASPAVQLHLGDRHCTRSLGPSLAELENRDARRCHAAGVTRTRPPQYYHHHDDDHSYWVRLPGPAPREPPTSISSWRLQVTRTPRPWRLPRRPRTPSQPRARVYYISKSTPNCS